jgi:predicted AlkP superfamily phosphohydrolase/phosphomutase
VKVFILGLDGITFDLLSPMIGEGILPNLSSLCSSGSSGPLRTIFPPVTGPAWLALATGLNPGKTGVFDYINRRSPGGHDMIPISSAYYENRAVWDHLGREGYKVGIFNYPTLSPPPVVNGFSVSGMGGYSKEHLCYPMELEEELQQITNGYEVKLNLRNNRYYKNPLQFLDDVNRVIRKQAKAMLYLMREKEWDFFFGVFHFTDWMQHLLWKYIDETHPLHDRKSSEAVKQQFKNTWRKLDEIIGELIGMLPDGAQFMIVSDHGAGKLDSAFYPNTWLEKRGWLRRNKIGWKGYLAGKMRPLSSDIDNKYLSSALNILKRRILKTGGTMELIDMENSLAYSGEHAGMYGCINLTMRGKSTEGFRDLLVKEIKNLPHSKAGITNIEVYLPEDIYSGPYVDLAPDILFIVNEHRASVEIDFAEQTFIPAPSIKLRTGGHRPDGIFIAKGSMFRQIQVRDISVLDIAPTVLSLYGLDLPSNIDGTVMTECFMPEVLKHLTVEKKLYTDQGPHKIEEKGDLEEMKKTLQSLGYM